MHAEPYLLAGLFIIKPKRHSDARGFFTETFKSSWFRQNIADQNFVQDNLAFSNDVGTLRGLHYQTRPFGQGKLISCLRGAIFDVAVDLRHDSRTFGQWAGIELDPDNHHQLWVPEGFAHGYITLKPDTEVSYKVTAPYCPAHDRGIAFDDPDIGIDWPVAPLHVSEKDQCQPSFAAYKKQKDT